MEDAITDLGITTLGQVHVLVDDIDQAAEFYRDVMGFLEMQSHNISGNAGLSTYYGVDSAEYEDFSVSLRFMTWPGVLTLKLIQVHGATVSQINSKKYDYLAGLGPLSVECADLDATFQILKTKARDYSAKWNLHLLSEPVFLSPLKPHEIGTTKFSILNGNEEVLKVLEKSFPERAKFQLKDPFGVAWEFNNDMS